MDPRRRRPSRRLAVTLAILAALALPSAALAAHFVDVGSGDVHAPGIEYLADTGITLGCATNPDRFCPKDELTRAQMGSFLYRASGNDPNTPPSVNAAELDGRGPSAYTTTVWSDEMDEGVSLAGHNDINTEATVLSVDGLPAGEYVVTGHVATRSLPVGAVNTSIVVCRVRLDDEVIGTSRADIGDDPGMVGWTTVPLAGHTRNESGTADLEVGCISAPDDPEAPTVVGSPTDPVTQVIVTRVGDAS